MDNNNGSVKDWKEIRRCFGFPIRAKEVVDTTIKVIHDSTMVQAWQGKVWWRGWKWKDNSPPLTSKT